MLHSADGGITWQPQNSGTDYTLISVHFIDALNGWAVGDGGSIVHTSDGGKTWIRQKSPVSFYLMDVYFLTPLQGYVVTENTNILRTTDGGAKWEVIFSDTEFILKSISFSDSLHGWAVGEYGFIYHTDNGGQSWEKQAGHFGFSEKTGEMEGGTYLFDVAAVDSRNAWAVGIDGCVIRTQDGGTSWNKVEVPVPRTQLFCIAVDKEKEVAIGGNGTFICSMDGGQTWMRPHFDPPATYGWFYSITSRASKDFVAVGWEGAVYKSLGSNLDSLKRITH